jgi:hypothetical protein
MTFWQTHPQVSTSGQLAQNNRLWPGGGSWRFS